MAAVAALSAGASVAQAAQSSQQAADQAAEAQPSLVAPIAPADFAGATVQPQLSDDGTELHVTGSLATVDVARDAAGGFTLGALSLAPTSVSPDAGAAQVVGDTSAVYGATQPATTTIVRPTADGVESYQQLLGADAPSAFQWKVTPAGAERLEQVDAATVALVDTSSPPSAGGDASASPTASAPAVTDAAAQLSDGTSALAAAQAQVADGEVVAVISAPAAVDADGARVPTVLAADPDAGTVTLSIDRGSAAYPITAGASVVERTVAAAAAAAPQPGRDSLHDPALPGLHIYPVGHRSERGCTSSFAYTEPRFGEEYGLITAGHCFAGEEPTTIWAQGGKDLGPYSRQRDVRRTTADAGTITTSPPAGTRKVEDRVFIVEGGGTIQIVRVKARNRGRRNDLVCMSAAFSGFHCGHLITGGAGKDWQGRAFDGQRQVIHHVYKANFGTVAIRPGDSGAPVFTGDGVALGVFFARQAKHHTNGFYSQIRNVEDELNVRVMR